MTQQPQPILVRSSEGTSYAMGPSLFKVSGAQTAGRFDFFEMTVEYLSGPGLHKHANQDDTFYILEGTLAVQCGDDIFDLGPGDFITIPPGVAHTFDNIIADQPPVRVLNLMTPGGYDRYFAASQQLDENAGDAERARIEAQHEVTYIGPPLRDKLNLAETTPR